MLTPLSPKGCALGRDSRFLILVAFLLDETRRLFVKHEKNNTTHNLHVF